MQCNHPAVGHFKYRQFWLKEISLIGWMGGTEINKHGKYWVNGGDIFENNIAYCLSTSTNFFVLKSRTHFKSHSPIPMPFIALWILKLCVAFLKLFLHLVYLNVIPHFTTVECKLFLCPSSRFDVPKVWSHWLHCWGVGRWNSTCLLNEFLPL